MTRLILAALPVLAALAAVGLVITALDSLKDLDTEEGDE